MHSSLTSAPARAARLFAGAFFALAAFAAAGGDVAGRHGEPEALFVPATNLIAAVCSRYEAVSNLSFTVRREIPGKQAEMISRVVFARGGKLSSETLSPERRRTVVDGEFAWTLSSGGKKPRKTPFAEQSPAQKASVLCVPASPEESLSALDGATGVDCENDGGTFARKVVFRFLDAPAASGKRAVVALDAEGRVRQLDVFSDADLRWRLASFSWDAPKEVLPGVWLFAKTATETAVDGNPLRVVSRFDGLRANTAIDEGVFDAVKVFGSGTK